jgi:hypothetical protein
MLDYFKRIRNRRRFAPEAERNGEGGPIVISPDAKVSLDPNGAAFLHARSGVLFTSNRVGARIWQGLMERESVEAIAARISREYVIERDQTRRDTLEFVAELETRGFLSRRIGC